METQAINLFILNDNVEVAGKLRRYLVKRFGDLLHISLFFNSRSCLKMVDSHVHLVVVDDYLYEDGNKETPGIEILKKIKEKQPNTEVVILSSNENVGAAVEAMRSGARDYIRNKKGAWQRIMVILDQTIKQPIRYFVAEYGVNVFIFAFLITFIVMGGAVYVALRYLV